MTRKNAYLTRKQPSQARSRATFDAILEAAAQLLDRHGYTGTTTNRIAERAGVSIGSVYEYFPTKEAIFAALMESFDTKTFEFVLEQVQDVEASDPKAFVRRVLEARIDAALQQPKLEALLRAEIPESVFEAQGETNFARFDVAMRAFAASRPDVIRMTDLESGMLLGTHVVESTVRHFAATQPDRLRDAKFVDTLVDMMTRWILHD